ncbi:MAG: hypothetical protein ACRCYF_02475 [Shewanella sp.]
MPAEGRNERRNERAASGKGMKPALTRHSNIAHQRGNGTGNKPTGGKPVGSQLQKGAANGKPAAQGEGKSAGQNAGKSKPTGKPAHKSKTPTRAGSAKPGVKPAAQGGKLAAKGNGAKRPAR